MGSPAAGAWDLDGRGFAERYPEGLVSQGVAAELIAVRWGITREESDAWSLRSHHRAAEARDSRLFDRQIVPVTRPDGVVVAADEGIRADTTVGRLAALPSVFHSEEMAARFPEIGWIVTAGSSSQVSDGASAALVVGEDVAERWGLEPRAAVVAGVAVGSDPLLMLTGVIPATNRLLERTHLSIGDFDTMEVNEAFAPVVLAWLEETKADPDRVNPAGGAIAIGHPAGASGCRLVATAMDTLECGGGRRALVTLCESGGMANAMVLEQLSHS
jgi:acetyl-CoA acyltransferase